MPTLSASQVAAAPAASAITGVSSATIRFGGMARRYAGAQERVNGCSGMSSARHW